MGDSRAAKRLGRALGGEPPKLLRRRCAAGVPEGITDIEENCSEWHYVVRSTCPALLTVSTAGAR